MPKLSDVISKKHLKSICGLVLIIFSLLICVPFGYVSRYLFFGIVFVFGNLFVFPLAFLFYYGIKLLFAKKANLFHNFSIKLGVLFLFLSLSIILSYTSTAYNGDVLITSNEINFSNPNFYDNYISSINNDINLSNLTLSNSFYSGGLLGYILIATFNLANSTTAFLSIVVCVSTILTLLFFIFAFNKPLKKIFVSILKRTGTNKEEKVKDEIIDNKTLVNSENQKLAIEIKNTSTTEEAGFVDENETVAELNKENVLLSEEEDKQNENDNLDYIKVKGEQIEDKSNNAESVVKDNLKEENSDDVPTTIKLNDQFENKSDVSVVTFVGADTLVNNEEIKNKDNNLTLSKEEIQKQNLGEETKEQFIQMQDALSISNKLGKHFIDDFDQIYNNPKFSHVGSLIENMKNLYNEVKEIKMAPNGEKLNKIQLQEWFFKSSTNLANLFADENIQELKDYEIFFNQVLISDDIFSSLMYIEIFNLNKFKTNDEETSNSSNHCLKDEKIEQNDFNGNYLSNTKDVDKESNLNLETNVDKLEDEINLEQIEKTSQYNGEKENASTNLKINDKVLDNTVSVNKNKIYNYEDFVPLDIDKFLQNIKDDENIAENNALAEETIVKINAKFEQLGVGAKAISYKVGPTVTRFDIQPNDGVPISSLDKYIDDISMALSGRKVRFEKIVFGKTTSSFEVSNLRSNIVRFYDVMKNMPEIDSTRLDICFGKDINDDYVICDLTKTPHMLVCGETGSGKSILVQNFVISLMMRISPKYLKFVFIDPKVVEFNRYKECPHLLCPPVINIEDARPTISKLCEEMDERFNIFSDVGCVDIFEYNAYQRKINGEEVPFIVLIIDEFADLVTQDKTVTSDIVRLASKARSAGIHMIVATQRPSADVISGLIKSNIPTRVALSVKDGTNSKIILDELGAENLLGHGDMLVSGNAVSKNGLLRVQAPLVLGDEIRSVIAYLKSKYPYQYDEDFLNIVQKAQQANSESPTDSYINSFKSPTDVLYDQVKEFAFTRDYISISVIMRTFPIGFNRAGKLFDMLIKDGIIEKTSSIPSRGNKVLIKCQEQFDDIKNGE